MFPGGRLPQGILILFLLFLYPAAAYSWQESDVSLRLKKLEEENQALQKEIERRFNLFNPDEALLKKSPTEKREGNYPGIDFQPDYEPPDIPNAPILDGVFKDGFIFQSQDKAFTLHAGTLVQFSNGWYSVPDRIEQTLKQPLLDGSDLRRMRLRFDGTVYSQFLYVMEFDVSGGTDFRTVVADPQAPLFINQAWMGMKDLPLLGLVRIGHLREYFSFANATGGKFIPFMERPLVFDGIEDAYSFSNGISSTNQFFDKRLNLLLGFFRTGTRTGAFGIGDGRYAFDQRLCYFPILDEENQRWAMVGAGGSIRTLPYNTFNTANGQTLLPHITFFTRPLVRTGAGVTVPRIISTPDFFSNSGQTILALSAQGAVGPWTLGGEYLATWIPSASLNTLPGYGAIKGQEARPIGALYFDGFYVQALRFLTPGDHRPVVVDTPGYGRVCPQRPFQILRREGGVRGWGAWEAKFRYDMMDLTNSAIALLSPTIPDSGGRYQALTFGLNWYWNDNLSVISDYVYNLRRTGQVTGSGSFSSFGIRTQFEF